MPPRHTLNRFRFQPRVFLLEDRTVPAVHTYDNGGATFNWSDAGNWDAAGVPTTGEAGGTIVVFPFAGVTSNQNIPGLVIDRIDFTNTNNTVTLVQPLGLSGQTAIQLTNAAGANTMTGGTINLSV